MEDESSKAGSHNLGHTDGAVEETQVSTHMSTFQRVGEQGEWQCQHRRPSTSDEDEGNEEHVLVVDELEGHETNAT